ncbi:hypothetical protein [Aromatoleum evansii]|uniref:hypothetical protein n=1 Tax=Aromatoleum evansii TaxID=59406 RepID=UPI00145FAF4F|nr:hypothetical protein [Aromatoleum evansii]NMG32202.1 hypothetical protein [Aromatoleum evansii]
MKKMTLIAAMAAAVLPAAPGMAQSTANPPASDTQVQQQAPDIAEFDKQMAQMQQGMQRMQEQMEKIRQTQDPQERQKLLQEHWETMRSGMGAMHGMWGPGMMGCCAGGPMMGGGMRGGHMMGWRGMGDYYSKLTPDQMKQRQYMMDRYMGMQQQMMDHMMQHQGYMSTQPPR